MNTTTEVSTVNDHKDHDPANYGPEDDFCSDCEAWQYDQIVSSSFLKGLERIQERGF